MTVSATNTTPRFFGFSVISGNYTLPASKNDCEDKFKSNGYYENVRDTLAQKLAEIFGKNFPTTTERICSDENCKCGQYPIKECACDPKCNCEQECNCTPVCNCEQECDSLYKSIFRDICDDSVESNIAYKFYVNQIVKKINELDSYINEAKAILADYTDNKLTRLQLLDTFCKKIEIEFSHYYSYDPEEDVFKVIEEDCKNSNYSKTQLNNDTPTSYDELRKDTIPAYPSDPPTTKTIECFNELNLLDRLKYIKLYYDCGSGKTDALFPNDNPEEAYPAVSVPKSTAYNKETYTTGQLELFYIGYLVDRDGPIGGLCSFIEFKSISLLKNIEIETLRIKAINAYLAYLNQASMSLNGRKKDAGVPERTYGIVALICNGFARNIKQLTINGVTSDYLVLQRDYTDGDEITSTKVDENTGHHISKTNYYMLVKLDEGVSNFITYHADSPFVMTDKDTGRKIIKGNELENVTDPSTGESFNAIKFYNGFKYEGFDCRDIKKNNHELLIVEIPTFVTSDNGIDYSFHINFLPKELDVTTISMESIYGYKDGSWKKNKDDMNGKDATEKTDTYNRMISSWQTAIDNYTSNLNTALESINSDIEVWRSKMDTWDALANKIRHRDYEIRQNLMSRALR